MIIVKIIGGLGNQMFQFALFLTLKEFQKEVKIDITPFLNYSLHQGFEIHKVFKHDFHDLIACESEISQLKDMCLLLKLRYLVGQAIGMPNYLIRKSHIIQKNFSQFYPEIFNEDNIYLDGYWQSEKYFTLVSEKIKKTFQWPQSSGLNRSFEHNICNENSVSVHIRRYDKFCLRKIIYWIKLRLVWRVCSKTYYLNAINYICSNVENPVFYIFSDDVKWVEKNLKMNGVNSRIVVWNQKEDSHWDMYLMSKCKHNIISMSSFSWWSAWLNSNPEKIVISPKKWALRYTKIYDLIPDSWLQL